jgi:hypothetical protein
VQRCKLCSKRKFWGAKEGRVGADVNLRPLIGCADHSGVSGNIRKSRFRAQLEIIQCLQKSSTTSNDYTVPSRECLSIQWTQYRMPIMSPQNKGRASSGDQKFLQDIESSSFCGSNTTTATWILLRQFPARKSTHELEEECSYVYGSRDELNCILK